MENRMISDPNSDPNSDCPASPNFSPKKAPPLFLEEKGGIFRINSEPTIFEVEAEIRIGACVSFRGQRYELVDVAPYTRKDGAPSSLLTWHSHCAICDEPFATKSGMQTSGLQRCCSACGKPGQSVARRRRNLATAKKRKALREASA